MNHEYSRLDLKFDLFCIYSLICHIFFRTCYKEPQERLFEQKKAEQRGLSDYKGFFHLLMFNPTDLAFSL